MTLGNLDNVTESPGRAGEEERGGGEPVIANMPFPPRAIIVVVPARPVPV